MNANLIAPRSPAPSPMWIPVQARLPTPLEDVLVAEPDEESGGLVVFMGYHTGNRGWRATAFEDLPITVTHWMPLPEPPKC